MYWLFPAWSSRLFPIPPANQFQRLLGSNLLQQPPHFSVSTSVEVTFPITVTEYLTRRTYKNIYFGSRYEGAGWYGGKKWYSWSQCINNPEGDHRQEVGQDSRTLFSQWPTSSSQGLYLKVTQPSITYYHLRIKYSNSWTYRKHFIFKL